MQPARDSSCFAANVRDLDNETCLACKHNVDCGIEEKMREVERLQGGEYAEDNRARIEHEIRTETRDAVADWEQANDIKRSNIRLFPSSGNPYRSSPTYSSYSSPYKPPQVTVRTYNRESDLSTPPTTVPGLAPNGWVGVAPVAYAPRQEGESFMGRLAKNFICEAIGQGMREAGVTVQAEKFTSTSWFSKKKEVVPELPKKEEKKE